MKFQYLIIHCTATPECREVSKEDIIKWHTAPAPDGHGWRKVGYTDMFPLNGGVINLTPFDQDDDIEGFEITNGVRGKNSMSRSIVYVGGCDKKLKPKDTRTPEQIEALAIYIKYMVMRHPSIQIAGHYMFDKGKACPSFDVRAFCKEIGLKEQNIFKKL